MRGLALRRFFVANVAPAFAAVGSRWRSAVVVAGLGALAAGILIPARSLAMAGSDGRPAISLPEVPSAGPALMWSDDARPPASTQARALSDLLALLSALSWVGFGIAGYSVFSLRAAESADRALEAGVRRAAGASLRQLLLSLGLETAAIAAGALLAGAAIGGALLSLARHWWPGVVGAPRSAGSAIALAVGAVFAAAAAASAALFRSRHLTAPPAQELGLRIPTFQVGAAVAMLMAGTALLGRERSNPPAPVRSPSREAVVFDVDSGLGDPESRSFRYAAVIAGLRAHRGVTEVSLSSAGAMLGLGTIGDVTTDCGWCYFGGIVLRWPNFTALAHAISPDSFQAENLRVVSGRAFRSADSMRAERVAVVNRSLALHYFQRGQAVGRKIYLGPGWPDTGYTVIGVVRDERSPAIGASIQPRETVYVSLLQHPPRRVELLVAASPGAFPIRGDAEALVGRLLGASSTVRRIGTADAYRSAQAGAVRWFGWSFAVVALVVLVLALAGTFSTAKRWAESMAWEYALRRAVGARKLQIAGLVLRRTAAVGAWGVALGLFLYLSVLGPALSASVADLPPARAEALVPTAIVAVMIALLAGALPGLRLLRRPPSAVLR